MGNLIRNDPEGEPHLGVWDLELMLRVDRKIISRKRHLHQLLGQKEIATISNHCPRVWAEERGCTGFYMFQNVRHILIIRSEEHASELQSLMRISYAVFCLKKQINHKIYKL